MREKAIAPKFAPPGLDGLCGVRGARKLQVCRKRQLEGLGFSVYCVDSAEKTLCEIGGDAL